MFNITNVYETMWNELKNRVSLNISQEIPVTDMIRFINALEEHFQQEIKEEKEK